MAQEIGKALSGENTDPYQKIFPQAGTKTVQAYAVDLSSRPSNIARGFDWQKNELSRVEKYFFQFSAEVFFRFPPLEKLSEYVNLVLI